MIDKPLKLLYYMFKKFLLLTLLMAILMPWQAKAQETLTVCDGTTTNRSPVDPAAAKGAVTQGGEIWYTVRP